MSSLLATLSDSQIAHIFDDLPLTLYVKDSQSRFLYVNKACAAYFGYRSPSEVLGHTDRDIFSEPHASEALIDERSVIKTGRPIIDKEEMETWPGGRGTWVLTSKLPLCDQRGRIVGTFGISKDITKTKAELERYRSAVEGAEVGLWFRDLQSDTVWFSPRWKEILGYRDDEIPNDISEWTRRLHPEDAARVEREISLHLSGRTPVFESTFRVEHREGTYRWIRARGTVTRDNEGKVKAFAGSRTDITETLDREEFYRRILDMVPSLVFLKDRDLRLRYVNEAVTRALGLRRDQILGKTDADVNPDPEQVSHFQADDRTVLETMDELEIKEETLTDSLGGNRRILATKKVPLLSPSGSLHEIQVLGVSTDITALRGVTTALEQERQLLDCLMNSVPDGISVKDREGKFVSANRALASLGGLDDPSQLIGKSDVELFGEDYARIAREEEEKIFETGVPLLDIVRKTPTSVGLCWRLIDKVPIMDVDGRVVQIVAISKDVTERVEAQVQLTRQKELLGKILDHLPESVFVRDGDGVWQMCNRSFAERHGFDSPGEFIGDADFGRGGLYFSEEDRISDNAVIEGEARLVRRAERQRPDGSLIVEEITKFPLHDEYGRVVAVLGISEDITGRLRAEAEHLQEQKRRLQEHITRSIGHCLKNRVTTLETCRYALEQQFGHTKALDLMKDAIASFKHALRVALSFERLEAGMQREWVSINVALMKLTEQLQDPRLRLLDLAEAAIVLGDGFHIENALLELLHNALAFAPRSELGGVVRVWTEVRDDVCFIHVADNGPGIREDLREHLFDRFSRGDPSRTGMGLAYVREVFQQPRAAWSPYTPGRPERTSLLGFRFTMLRIRS